MRKMVCKKSIFTLIACSLALVATTGCGNKNQQHSAASNGQEQAGIANAQGAMADLNAGNAQFLQGSVNPNVSSDKRTGLAQHGQKPHTVIITCSDSRVPPELIFNSDLGEVFVIRTAGNVVGDYEIGSVEYAVDHLGSPLVLVMGHTHCGAVGAAVESGHAPGSIEKIVKEIKPSVDKAKKEYKEKEQIADAAENFNVENSINRLMDSKIISSSVKDGKTEVKGCKYNIETGAIQYFENKK